MKSKKPKEKKIKPIKVKKPKKKMPKEIASTALLWIVAAMCLGITLPLHFRFSSFSWQWVVFVAVFVISPFALLNFKCYAESKNDFTQEQIQNTNVQFSKMVFGVWFWDFVFMAFFNHWEIASFILGAAGAIKFFYTLAINFAGRKKREPIFDFLMICDFLAGTALAVYLIYLIPDKTVQTIVTTIVAAMFGGLLTLVGVAWTIRRQDDIRKEEEIKKAKPIFILNKYQYEPRRFEIEKECSIVDDADITQENEILYLRKLAVEIENSNYNAFEIVRVFHDKKWFMPNGKTVVLPSKKITLSLSFNLEEDIILDICDSIECHHFYLLQIFLPGNPFENEDFYSINNYKEIPAEELQARNIPLEVNP